MILTSVLCFCCLYLNPFGTPFNITLAQTNTTSGLTKGGKRKAPYALYNPLPARCISCGDAPGVRGGELRLRATDNQKYNLCLRCLGDPLKRPEQFNVLWEGALQRGNTMHNLNYFYAAAGVPGLDEDRKNAVLEAFRTGMPLKEKE
jgi:hypothetical protein